MSGLETAFLRVGGTVVKHVATAWLTSRKTENRRGAELTELIAQRFGGLRERDRRALRRKLDEVGELAGEQLEELCAREFAELAENERLAALDAVVDALADADLSDAVLLGADLHPISLAMRVRDQVPDATARAGLGADAQALFDRALDQSCVQLVHLVRELPEYDSRLAEETLRRASAVLSGIDRILARLPVTSLDAPAGADHDEQFRARYLDLVAKHNDDLELIGVSIRNFRPKTRLSVAYLSLSVDEGRHRNDPWSAQQKHRNESMRVEAALSRAELTLVRGEAGSGKSTLLRWIAVQAARNGFTGALQKWNGRVPVLIKLRSYADRPLPHPEEFLSEPRSPLVGPVPAGWVHRRLIAGEVLLLADGVDELVEDERGRVRDWLGNVLQSYPGTAVVVTARPAAASTTWLRAEGFTAVDLEHMTASDVHEFLRRWHQALLDSEVDALPFDRAEVRAHQRGLIAKLDARPHLRNLARSPLLCAMLCALNLDRGGDLPRDRKNLYEAALEMLLVRRESLRGIRHEIDLTYAQKLVLLQDLAFWLNLNGRAEIDRDNALRRIERKLPTMPGVTCRAEDCLDYLVERSGVVREPAEDRIDFVHRTFQEFLAAREIAAEEHVPLLVDNAHSDQWRETVIMAAGLLTRPRRADLLTGLLDRAEQSNVKQRRRLLLLIATCQESLDDLPVSMVDRLEAAIGSLVPPRNTRESQSLATVGEALLSYLPERTGELSAAQAVACVRTAALINGPAALERLAEYAVDPRGEVQDEIAAAWELFEPQAFAERVLAHAPLNGGHLAVRNLDQLPHLAKVAALQRVSLRIREEIDDLEFLPRDMPISAINAYSRTPVSLRPLRDHPELTYLLLSNSTSWADHDVLRELSGLRHLFFAQRPGPDRLDFLDNLPRLRELWLFELQGVTDYAPITNSADLEVLSLQNPRKIGFLSDLTSLPRLRELHIHDCVTADVFDRTYESFPELRRVLFNRCWITDLAALGALPDLRRLEIIDCPSLTSVEALRRMPRLRTVHLRGTRPGLDLSPMAGRDIRVIVGAKDRVKGIPLLRPGTVRRV
ncbi:NACHT domain-containing protein [Saccharopolyspora sp. NPDC003752]